MILNSLLIISLLMSLYVLYKLYNYKRHDKALYPICQIRRDMLEYIMDNNDLSDDEYKILCELISDTDHFIHEYNSIKKKFLNFKHLKAGIQDYLNSKDRSEADPVYDNPKLREYMYRVSKYIFMAFFIHVAFAKSRIIIVVLSWLTFQIISKANSSIKNFGKAVLSGTQPEALLVLSDFHKIKVHDQNQYNRQCQI